MTTNPANTTRIPQILLDNKELGRNGLATDADVALACGGCKIVYPKSLTGVFPPTGFEPEVAYRSAHGPRATLFLDHVYGYEGNDNLDNNLFFNHKNEARSG